MQSLLVRRWFRIIQGSVTESDATATPMLDRLQERDEIAGLAANPMVLTALCVIYYTENKELPQDQYDLYSRIVANVLNHRYPNDKAMIDLVRNRLGVVAFGMHTGVGLGEEREDPLAEATFTEIDRMLKDYLDESGWTEPGFRGVVAARDDLLHSGLLLPCGHERGSFYHLSFQDFLAAQRLVEVQEDRLFEVYLGRSSYAGWRNTLRFAFGFLLPPRYSSIERGRKLLGRLVDALQPEMLGLSVVVADCLDIWLRRDYPLKEDVKERFRQICLSAIGREVSLRERHRLGLSLGQLADPRIVTDLRNHDATDQLGRPAFLDIPAGVYLVGDDRKRYQISESFRIARYPVTNRQFACFMDDCAYQRRECWLAEGWAWLQKEKVREPLYWRLGKWNGANQPVVGISFWEAEAFCTWAGGRLPREYEWEAAARGPNGLEYPWGPEWTDGICNSYEAGLRVTSPVGLFPSSRSRDFQLEDMAGNVWEWCSDFRDPKRPYLRVLRGGSWLGSARGIRPANRSDDHTDDRDYNVGFRMVLAVGVRTRNS